jgi:Cellulase (glycosyl hydrolase family 5)/Bacterial Ig domain
MIKNLTSICHILACTLLFNTLVLAQTPTPLAANGRLKVINRQLCNESGSPIQLRGISTHGLQWFGACHTAGAAQTLATSWGCDVFRAAMYVDEGGYLSNPTAIKTQVDNITDWSAASGMYCIIDWHTLNPGDPNNHTAAAINFFRQEAQRNAGKKHVIYEICNEPNGVSWASIKNYAEQVIPVIRQYDPEAIILVGTPNWSGTPADVTSNPLTGANAYNIMYTFHFYAGSHYTQSYINGVLATLPLFVSEWGTSNYSGDGGNDYTNAQNWMNLLAGANTSGIKVSWCNWSFCDKSESSAALNPGACGNTAWNNTSTSGTWVKNRMLSPADSWASGTTTNIPPSVSITSPTNNAAFNAPGSVTITASATDADGTIGKVELFNGSTLLATLTSAPYTYTWSNVAAGTYTITAKATDNSAAVTTSPAVNVVVNAVAANVPPSVSLTAPTNNATFTAPATINFSANATDADGTIASVKFYNGAALLATKTVAPYTFSWTGVAVGTYTITAKATDNSAALTTSTAVTIVVQAAMGNQLPTVSITSPVNNAAFNAPASLTINANATDADGTIANVMFYNGSTLLATLTSAPYAYTWANVAAGTYAITAKATDNQGGVRTSSAVQVVVNAVSTGANLIGVDCVNKNAVTIFELSAANRVNATNYSWWANASTSSIVPVSAQPWKATYSFGQWFTGGNVCVGVNYSQAPWYAQFCKNVTTCSSARLVAKNNESVGIVSPNPSVNVFNILADKNIQSAQVFDQLGTERINLGAFENGQSLNFGATLPAGIYFLQMTYADRTNHTVKLVKVN